MPWLPNETHRQHEWLHCVIGFWELSANYIAPIVTCTHSSVAFIPADILGLIASCQKLFSRLMFSVLVSILNCLNTLLNHRTLMPLLCLTDMMHFKAVLQKYICSLLLRNVLQFCTSTLVMIACDNCFHLLKVVVVLITIVFSVIIGSLIKIWYTIPVFSFLRRSQKTYIYEIFSLWHL